MKRRYKNYLKINFVSIIIIAVSFTSATLAWFAYSGLNRVQTVVNVKAWYIELENNGETVSSDIVISSSDIYPGMETTDETILIKNEGDSDASINYAITSARILDDNGDRYVVEEGVYTTEEVEDIISHNYPFNINISLDRNYVIAKGEEATFEVSITWPLDSGDDNADSYWGSQAYLFQTAEQEQFALDNSYTIRPAIQVVISVTAEQYLEVDESSDFNYNLGDTLLYDVVSNTSCDTLSATCLNTRVIDNNNTLGDDTVTLMLNPLDANISSDYNNYASNYSGLTGAWTVTNRPLELSDLLNIVSRDITDSVLVREGISNSIIGSLKYTGRMDTEISKAKTGLGHYQYISDEFSFLSSNTCYWTNTEYDTNGVFALIDQDETYSKIYNEAKTTSCKVIPVIEVLKSNIS